MGKWLKLSIVFIILYNEFYDFTLYYKEKEQGKKNDKASSKISAADEIIAILVLLSLIIGILMVFINGWFPGAVVIVLLMIPTLLMYFIGSMKAADKLKYIVIGHSDDTNDLTIDEKIQFDIFVIALLVFNQFFSVSKVISFIKENITSYAIMETVLTVFLLLLSFFIAFITLVELMLPLKHLCKGCEYLNCKLGGHFRHLSFVIWKEHDDQIIKARLTNVLLGKCNSGRLFAKILLLVLLIPTFVIDFIVNLLLLIYSSVRRLFFGTILEFLRMVGSGALRLLRLISNIPEHRVVKNTFRLSGIIAIVLVVIINRMGLFFEADDSFLEITEFLASAVLIPIIYEWISSKHTVDTNT